MKELKLKITEQEKNAFQRIHETLLAQTEAFAIDFVRDESLRKIILQEYKSLVYTEKMQEILQVSDEAELHVYLKFQIVQYASIYEAIIDYLLFTEFKHHKLVEPLLEQEETRKIPELQNVKFSINDRDAFFYRKKTKKRDGRIPSVPFKERVKVSEKIGFISSENAVKIQDFYDLRNSIHLRARAQKQVNFESEACQSAKNVLPQFLERINSFQKISEAYQQLEKSSVDIESKKSSILVLFQIAQTNPEKAIEICSSLANFTKTSCSKSLSNPAFEIGCFTLKKVSALLQVITANRPKLSLDISCIDLKNADLSSSEFRYVHFEESILSNVNFSSSDLLAAKFSGSSGFRVKQV